MKRSPAEVTRPESLDLSGVAGGSPPSGYRYVSAGHHRTSSSRRDTYSQPRYESRDTTQSSRGQEVYVARAPNGLDGREQGAAKWAIDQAKYYKTR